MKKKDTMFYKIVKPLVIFLIKVLFRPTVVGKENIPTKGPLVLAGNHTKWLDPVLLVAINKRQVHFLAKIELFNSWKTRWIVKGMGAIPVDRKAHDGTSLIYAKEMLDNNKCIGIFPEGTINRTDEVIMPFKLGAVKMSKESNATLVPFVITGKYKLFKKKIKIEFLKPIKVQKDLEKTNQKLMDVVSEKLIEGEKNGEDK